MTAQVHDQFFYETQFYPVIGIDGEGWLTPKTFGLKTVGFNTGNYRGYVSTHYCYEGQLYLTEFHVDSLIDFDGKGWKPINGVKAIPYIEYGVGYRSPDGDWIESQRDEGKVYQRLNMKSKFSGGVVIGADMVHEFSDHYGFARPFQFEIVYELLFEDGILTEAINQSEQAKVWREVLLEYRAARHHKRMELVTAGWESKDIDDDAINISLEDVRKGSNWQFSRDYKILV